ncbi:hypothetical protein [Cellvibrio japonicus]|nr:hypothetical protein [Cellvibrio japonicus]QEI13711.1 hypothetical protein FY117_16825 [Cellvibrio japonicus]QEI17285.1 hypothetical protein FY116_16830 [Cellvibrio japonicus]QEI20862.1 hypothetical protein FY115_16825 [Cellvibrio japonicus]
MTTLNIGEQAFDSKDIASKVQSDIRFLISRLQHLEQQPNPNPIVLQTYRDMLESRQAVLDWLVQDKKAVVNH